MTSNATQIAKAFGKILCPDDAQRAPVTLASSGHVAARLRPFWPELDIGTGPAPLQAMDDGDHRTRQPGLMFAPGLLRAPSRPAHAGSSTIVAGWDGRRRSAGLGARLLARMAPSGARGAALAAAIVAHRIGARPGAAVPAGGWHRLLVASGARKADRARVRSLLQTGAASQLLVLATDPGLIRMARGAGCAVAAEMDDPWALIDQATTILAPAEHPLALFAALAGRAVTATGDALPVATPAQIATAFLVDGARYADGSTGAPIACEAFLDRLIDWQRLQHRVPLIACFTGISFWKRRRMSEFLGVKARFARDAAQAVRVAAESGGAVGVWPSRAPKGLDEAAAAAGVKVFRIEDGFIRSRGLGADFIPPASVILDGRGIYYDPRRPSDLETILAEQEFSPALLDRSARLIDTLVARGISKYNLAGATPALGAPRGARRILVPGQVADDQSILAGAGAVGPNLPLLQAVRAANPDAFIVFKPHPDVEAGHRSGAVTDAAALAHADLVLRDCDIIRLMSAVDEIHTVTSLAGFEALIRGVEVTTYGRPFYAGWGLTHDLDPPPNRHRRLSVAELVAGTLILYPHYLDPLTGLPCGPEALIERLDQQPAPDGGRLIALRRLQGLVRRSLARGKERIFA